MSDSESDDSSVEEVEEEEITDLSNR